MSTKFPGLEVAIVNPTRARGNKKGKAVARKRARTKGGQFKKTTTRRRANRESNPRRRRRRRRRSPATSSSAPVRRRRRRNPSDGGGRAPIRSQGMWPLRGADYRMVLPMLAQKVLTALVVTKWGETGRLMAKQGNSSHFAGRSWPLRNYVMSFGVGVVGAKLVGARFGKKAGEFFYLSNIADMGERMLWSEVFNNTSWGPKYFGQSPADQMAALRSMPMGYDPGQADAMAGYAMPGAIYETPSGRFMLDNQRRWQPMQGELVAADSGFDGFGSTLTAADSGFDGFGHALPAGVDDLGARYRRDGAADPYQSNWMTY
jgi:hypothetical protein